MINIHISSCSSFKTKKPKSVAQLTKKNKSEYTKVLFLILNTKTLLFVQYFLGKSKI